MGRGRSGATITTSAAATTATTTATTVSNAIASSSQRIPKKCSKPGGNTNETDPSPDDGDESGSQDSSVRMTRRSLTASKDQSTNALSKTEIGSNKRGRPRKAPQLNSVSLSSSEIRSHAECLRDDMLASNKNSRAINSNNSSTIQTTKSEADVIKIDDETEDLTVDTDTMTTELDSSSVGTSTTPDSNDAACSADDEGERFTISDDSQTRSSSVIVNMPEDSNSAQIIEFGSQEMENATAIQANSKIQLRAYTSPTPTACRTDDSSPDFLNLPKPKIVRTYQNRRKLKNNQESTNALVLPAAPAAIDKDKNDLNKSTDGVETSVNQEAPECRRSQRKKIMKYDVRDLLNKKGSRTQAQDAAKNNNKLNQLQKLQETIRSESDSSPQNFKGFSDVEDRTSPISIKRTSIRLRSVTPTLSLVFQSEPMRNSNGKASIIRKISYDNIKPAEPVVAAAIAVPVANNSEPVSQVSVEDSIVNRAKVTKAPLKKEPQQPSRIMTRRKTLLLSRPPEDLDNIDDTPGSVSEPPVNVANDSLSSAKNSGETDFEKNKTEKLHEIELNVEIEKHSSKSTTSNKSGEEKTEEKRETRSKEFAKETYNTKVCKTQRKSIDSEAEIASKVEIKPEVGLEVSTKVEGSSKLRVLTGKNSPTSEDREEMPVKKLRSGLINEKVAKIVHSAVPIDKPVTDSEVKKVERRDSISKSIESEADIASKVQVKPEVGLEVSSKVEASSNLRISTGKNSPTSEDREQVPVKKLRSGLINEKLMKIAHSSVPNDKPLTDSEGSKIERRDSISKSIESEADIARKVEVKPEIGHEVGNKVEVSSNLTVPTGKNSPTSKVREEIPVKKLRSELINEKLAKIAHTSVSNDKPVTDSEVKKIERRYSISKMSAKLKDKELGTSTCYSKTLLKKEGSDKVIESENFTPEKNQPIVKTEKKKEIINIVETKSFVRTEETYSKYCRPTQRTETEESSQVPPKTDVLNEPIADLSPSTDESPVKSETTDHDDSISAKAPREKCLEENKVSNSTPLFYELQPSSASHEPAKCEKKLKSKAELKSFEALTSVSPNKVEEPISVNEEKPKKKHRRSQKSKSVGEVSGTDQKQPSEMPTKEAVASIDTSIDKGAGKDETGENSVIKEKKKSKKPKEIEVSKEIPIVNGIVEKPSAKSPVTTATETSRGTKTSEESAPAPAKSITESPVAKEIRESKHSSKSRSESKSSRRSGPAKLTQADKDTDTSTSDEAKEPTKPADKSLVVAKENADTLKPKEKVNDSIDFGKQLSLADSIASKSAKDSSRQSKTAEYKVSDKKKKKKKEKLEDLRMSDSQEKNKKKREESDQKKTKKSAKASLKQQLDDVAHITPDFERKHAKESSVTDSVVEKDAIASKKKHGSNIESMFKRNRTTKENEELKSQKKRRISKLYSSVDSICDLNNSESVKSKQMEKFKPPPEKRKEDLIKIKKPSRWSDPKDDKVKKMDTEIRISAANAALELSPTDLLSELKRAQLAEMDTIPTVLNGLSNTVMNDLIAWTCNNKETVSRIKDTFDNQKTAIRNQETAKKLEEISNGPNIVDNARSFLNTLLEDKALVAQSKQLKEKTAEAIEAAETLIDVKEKLAEDGLNFESEDIFDSRDSSATSTPIPSTPIDEIKSKSYETDNSLKSDYEQSDQSSMDGLSSIRRSHRLKTQTKSTTVGRGLVRDRDMFKSPGDQKCNNNSELDAQNAKFLKDMEERLSQFQMIRENEYKCERIISKEAKRMTCDCFLTREEEDRGEMGCGEDCLNRLLMIECSSKCTNGERCTNRRFQRNSYAPCKVFRTEKKGFGIMADAEISSGEFIMEYVGEVLNGKQFEKRAALYSQDKNKHYYFMALRADSIIDATGKGSISRFINHSCDPNAETQKWTVNGELRIGFFSKRRIMAGEEITFDYQFQRYGKEAQKCFCESANCRGWIGEEPDSEEEEEEESSSESEEEPEKVEDEMVEAKAELELPEEPEMVEVGKTADVEAKPPKEVAIPAAIAAAEIAAQKRIEKSARKALKAAERFERIAAKMKAKKERERLKQEKRMALEDADIDAEITSLSCSGLKNQAHTLRFNRCMVRVKSMDSRLPLLAILRNGEMPCRRLFLDYHGLRLLHGWMSEIETNDKQLDLEFRRLTLETLEVLPIPNKTLLKESKVFDAVQSWGNEVELQVSPSDSPTDGSDQPPPSKKSKIDDDSFPEIRNEIKRLASKLVTAWEELPEVFRIPKRERIEQMKEHEREADRQYKALNLNEEDQYDQDLRNKERFGAKKNYKWVREKFDRDKRGFKDYEKVKGAEANLSKLQRRQLFAAKVAKDEAEKRLAEERREVEFKSRFYGLDPRLTNLNDMPFCVHPSTGQWFTKDKRQIPTPPSHAHIKVPPKLQSTDPKDYKMPEMDLPPMWKYAMDAQGRLYYYHVKIRIPQWEPPIKILPLTSDADAATKLPAEGASSSSRHGGGNPTEPQPSTSKQGMSTASDTSTGESDDSDSDISCSEIIGLKKGIPPKIGKDTVENLRDSRKRKRISRLVQERTISPRREEDRLYNQMEMRRYRENKEKIRRRKEEIKRRKVQQLRNIQEPLADLSVAIAGNTENNSPEKPDSPSQSTDNLSVPIQDYLLSSDDDDTEKPELNSSLIEQIVHGEKIVDELDAITKEKPLKRSLPFIKDRIEAKKRQKVEERKEERKRQEATAASGSGSTGSKSTTSDKSNKPRKSSSDSSGNNSSSSKNQSRRAKEKFRAEIAGIIVQHLTPYRRESCPIGRIINNEDFKHLARKLTHFVLIKELKHCDSTGQMLVVTESVKNKSREFIKKYMAKYGDVYVRPENDPEFRDIPL